IVEIDPHAAYPKILELLGVDGKETPIDQYWLEVAFQCAKMAVQEAIEDTEHDPRAWREPRSLVIHVVSAKDDWALAKFPKGKGIDPASKGREAKVHYDRIRRRLLRS